MVAPELLSKINERRVLEFVQAYGPSSRADMARACGMSAPTVSKAVASLIRHGFLEESGLSEGFGRPGKLLQFDARSANVLGVVVDAGTCWVGSARLDGEVSEESVRSFSTPETYPELLSAIERHVVDIGGGDVTSLGSRFRGVGGERSRPAEFAAGPDRHIAKSAPPRWSLSGLGAEPPTGVAVRGFAGVPRALCRGANVWRSPRDGRFCDAGCQHRAGAGYLQWRKTAVPATAAWPENSVTSPWSAQASFVVAVIAVA